MDFFVFKGAREMKRHLQVHVQRANKVGSKGMRKWVLNDVDGALEIWWALECVVSVEE